MTVSTASFQGYVTSHMMYVALDLLTHLQGLYLLNFDSQNVKVDSAVKVETLRLPISKRLHFKPTPIYHHTLYQHFKTVFINTRSLHKYVANNSQWLKHQTFKFADNSRETWAINSDPSATYDIPEFILTKQYSAPSPNPATRLHGGIMIYAKPELLLHSHFHPPKKKSSLISCHQFWSTHRELAYQHASHIQTSCCSILQTLFASVLNDITKKHMDTLAVGDFNIDQLKPSSALPMLLNAMKVCTMLQNAVCTHFVKTVTYPDINNHPGPSSKLYFWWWLISHCPQILFKDLYTFFSDIKSLT